MKYCRLILVSFAILAAISDGLFSAEASTIMPRFDEVTTNQNRTTNHAVFLKCKLNAHQEYQSKGAVLSLPKDLKKQNHDFAVVTAHGLENSQDCSVEDFQGNSQPITNFYFSPDYQPGTDTDWALISFKSLRGDHIERYNVDSYFEDIAPLDNAMISFAQARGLPSNTQRCRLAVVKLRVPNKQNSEFFSHDCRAIGGQSGSPITFNMNGQHKLVGFHLGSIWTLHSPITGKPGRLNFLRPYDKKMSTDIKRMIRNAKE